MQKQNHQIGEVRSHANRAFTLPELAIVLVIIGLVAGGVMVGRSLIEMAEARKIMTQMEKIQVAATTFRLKYNCMAGDCDKATQFGLGTNGNGDTVLGGTIAGYSPGCLFGTPNMVNTCMQTVAGGRVWMTSGYGEHQQFFAHLSSAGLLEQTIVDAPHTPATLAAIIDTLFPKDALNRYFMHAAMWNSKLYVRTGLASLTSASGDTTYATNPTLTSAQMQYIASKFSYPIYVSPFNDYPEALQQGQRVVPVSGYQYFYWPPNNAGTAAPACAVSDGAGGYKYNIAGGGRCDLLWQIDY